METSLRRRFWLGLILAASLSGCVVSAASPGYEPVYDYQYDRAYPGIYGPEYWPPYPYYGIVPRPVVIDGQGRHEERHHQQSAPTWMPPPKGSGGHAGEVPPATTSVPMPHFRRAEEREERPERTRPERSAPRPARETREQGATSEQPIRWLPGAE